MQSLITLQGQIDKEDPMHRAIFAAYQDIVEAMRADFAQYSDFIFKGVIDAAARKVDVHFFDDMETKKQ